MNILRRIPVFLELIALGGFIYWYFKYPSPEPIVSLLLVIAGLVAHLIPQTTNAEKIKRRVELKTEFQKKLVWNTHLKVFDTAIIRHIDRADNYPNVDNKKGVSPWFRLEVKGFYHKGIEVFIGFSSARVVNENWQFCKSKDKNAATVFIIGKIPFDLIETVDWSGDEYYAEPHIYLHYNRKRKEPYEQIFIAKKTFLPDGDFYYDEIGTYDQLEKGERKFYILLKNIFRSCE